MEKVINIFKDIISDEVYDIQEYYYSSASKRCAEETKNISIKFAEWISNKNYEYYNPEGVTASWFNKDNHSLDCTTEDLFNEFLKEYK